MSKENNEAASNDPRKVMRSRKYYAVLLCLVVAVVVVFFAHGRKRFYDSTGVVWTTGYHITYEAKCDMNDSIQAILDRVDRTASVYNKQSLISKINNGTTDLADDMIVRLLQASRAIHQSSSGAFDPTVMPLVNAWGFGYKSGQMPGKEQIDSILAFVGLDKISLNGRKITKSDPRVQLDFSSIAKGMACDELAAMLERNGATNVMVEIGGEVVAHGVNQRGQKWQVSVDLPTEQPDTVRHESVLLLQLGRQAVATSGNYRKFREQDGKKVTHIVDPHTGRSVESSLLSVTIIADDCTTADAWATACMVMGDEKTRQMFDADKKIGVMTITSKGDDMVVWSNATFASFVLQ